jgi:hypothetical protein
MLEARSDNRSITLISEASQHNTLLHRETLLLFSFLKLLHQYVNDPFMAKNNGPLLAALKVYIKKAGNQRIAAEKLGVSESFISDIVNSRKPVSSGIARKLGFEWRLDKVIQ